MASIGDHFQLESTKQTTSLVAQLRLTRVAESGPLSPTSLVYCDHFQSQSTGAYATLE